MLKRHVKKEKKMRTQGRYATCPQGMSKKERKEKKEKVSSHPRKTKKRDRSCKGVHPSSTKKKYIPTHLRVLIRLYDSFLLGSYF